MRGLGHWILFALALGAWGVAMAWSRTDGGAPGVIAGWTFFAVCVVLALLDVREHALPMGSPRMVGWLLVALTALFLPLLSLSGAWSEDSSSLIMLPAVGGTLVSWIALPWLCSAGPQPSAKQGRFTPVLLAWLGLALNLALTT